MGVELPQPGPDTGNPSRDDGSGGLEGRVLRAGVRDVPELICYLYVLSNREYCTWGGACVGKFPTEIPS